MIEVRDAFDLSRLAIRRTAVINPASGSFEGVLLALSTFAVGQDSAAEDS